MTATAFRGIHRRTKLAYDTWFGFDLIQRKTLEKKLAEAGGIPDLEQRLADLEARIEALEDAA